MVPPGQPQRPSLSTSSQLPIGVTCSFRRIWSTRVPDRGPTAWPRAVAGLHANHLECVKTLRRNQEALDRRTPPSVQSEVCSAVFHDFREPRLHKLLQAQIAVQDGTPSILPRTGSLEIDCDCSKRSSSRRRKLVGHTCCSPPVRLPSVCRRQGGCWYPEWARVWVDHTSVLLTETRLCIVAPLPHAGMVTWRHAHSRCKDV